MVAYMGQSHFRWLLYAIFCDWNLSFQKNFYLDETRTHQSIPAQSQIATDAGRAQLFTEKPPRCRQVGIFNYPLTPNPTE